MGSPEQRSNRRREHLTVNILHDFASISPSVLQEKTGGKISSDLNGTAVVEYDNAHITLHAVARDSDTNGEGRTSFLRMYGKASDGTFKNTDYTLDQASIFLNEDSALIIIPGEGDEFSWVSFGKNEQSETDVSENLSIVRFYSSLIDQPSPELSVLAREAQRHAS